MAKSVVVTFGRFNPPTIGHEKLAKKVMSVARAMRGADHMIFPSRTEKKKKDPLPVRDKIKFMRKGFRGANIVDDSDSTSIFVAMKKISDLGYKHVVLVVGSDRVAEFDRGFKKYIKGKGNYSLDFDSFKVISAGERDPDATGVEGMSASKMRKAVVDGDYDAFELGCPSGLSARDCKDMYNAVKKHMTVTEDIDELFEEFLDEISIKGRRNMAKAARRTARKRASVRKRKRMKTKTQDEIKKKAAKAARLAVRKKILKDRDSQWASMSHMEKERIDKQINKKKKLISKLQKRLLPIIKKKEKERIASLRKNKKNLSSEYDPGKREEGTPSLTKRYKKDSPGY